ncbi:hypothetical protein Tco_1310083 [Tanacetum coccineum]
MKVNRCCSYFVYTSERVIGIDVVEFRLDSISAISGNGFANNIMVFSGKKVAYLLSSYARVMVELKADVELKDNIVVAMPKIIRMAIIHVICCVVYMSGKAPAKVLSCKSFLCIKSLEECSKNTCVGFKPQKEYRPVTKNPNASSSVNKKNGVVPTVEFASNTPIGEKIDKIERQIGEGKLRLLDNDGNPLVPTGIVKSDSEVEVIFDDTANLMISTSGKDGSDKGYGTNSLLEQWRDSYPDNGDYDPYDDDMYENHDLSEHLQSICDDLDITVHGRKKK